MSCRTASRRTRMASARCYSFGGLRRTSTSSTFRHAEECDQRSGNTPVDRLSGPYDNRMLVLKHSLGASDVGIATEASAVGCCLGAGRGCPVANSDFRLGPPRSPGHLVVRQAAHEREGT